MKRTGIIFLSLLMMLLTVFGVHITLLALTDKGLNELPFLVPPSKVYEISENCTDRRIIIDTENSISPHIKKLGEYQEVCGSFITDKWMIFIDMPKDSIGAKRKAQELSIELQEFSEYGITPIIIVEPVTDWGLIDFVEFRNGLYTEWIEEFFEELLERFPQEQMDAIWVPFPEPNLPYWNLSTSVPSDVGSNISIYLSILKKYYPNAHGSILLNSKSYDSLDFNWEEGEYRSLVPYIEKIEEGLVDSVGMQGLPWLPPQGAIVAKPEVDPGEFLNSDLLFDIAYRLNVKDVWFNTGTFGTKYALDSEEIVFMTPSERKTILEGIVKQANRLRSKGFNVTINLFAEDKSSTPEQTNWAYWSVTSIPNEEKIIFIDFVKKVYGDGIGLSIYDR